MSIFREIPPTAGFPIHAKDFFSIIRVKDRQRCLENYFQQYFDIAQIRVTNSGTAAFYLILESLKCLSEKKTIIIPSFVCPLIPLAIKRAGLNIEVCDINRDNFSFDAEMLNGLCHNNNDILAIVAVHLAGLPIDFEAVERIAKKYDVFTVEDCAQALGALYNGRKVGTLADFSFFSLGRGKGPTTYQGGVIAIGKQEYADNVDVAIQRASQNNFLSEVTLILELIGYAIFYRPLLFWFVFRLPQLFWNLRKDKIKAAMEYFDIDFPVHSISATRQLIGYSQLLRLDNEITRQRSTAQSYIEELTGIGGIHIIGGSRNSISSYPFVTVVFDDPEIRERALRVIEASGCGGSFVYALAIADYGYLKDIVPDRHCSNARYLAERTITLSTNTFLKNTDLRSVAMLLRNL